MLVIGCTQKALAARRVVERLTPLLLLVVPVRADQWRRQHGQCVCRDRGSGGCGAAAQAAAAGGLATALATCNNKLLCGTSRKAASGRLESQAVQEYINKMAAHHAVTALP